MSDQLVFEHQSPAIVVILLIATCSIYYFVLLYKWIDAVNSISSKSNLDPALAIILSVVTCGLASIYFEYEVALRIERIIQEKKISGTLRNDLMAPPVNNLKNIVLYGSLASYAIAIFSAGFLYVLSLIFTLWLCCAIQYAVEYALDIPQD